MSAFGQSHRQLVEDTNKGTIHTPATERGASNAQISALNKVDITTPKAGAAALVSAAGTVAQPMIQEANRKKERDAYIAAGTEEGKQTANAAAKVWDNKIFGPDSSLRGAQARIGEDNARRLYLDAQDVLTNKGGDSWSDEEWADWRDNKIEEEVNKYDSQDMRDVVNAQMGQDFQKLERDRGTLHQQYLQEENLKSTTQAMQGIADTYNADRGSDTANRVGADAPERLAEISALKEKAGVSDKVFSNIVAQIAANELTEGKPDFAKFVEEAGHFDDLSFENQKILESSQRVHEIKHGEEFGRRSDELYGQHGLIAQGNVEGALAAYDDIVAEFPEAQGPGRNAIREQVRQQAWKHAEATRHRAARAQHAKTSAESGTNMPMPVTDAFGNTTYVTLGAHEMIMGMEAHLKEKFTNEYNATARQDDATHQNRHLEPQEMAQMYSENSAYVGQLMQRNNQILPEVQTLITDTTNLLNSDLHQLSASDQAQLKQNLHAIEEMSHSNEAVASMMYEHMGEDYGMMMSANRFLQNENNSVTQFANQQATIGAKQRAVDRRGEILPREELPYQLSRGDRRRGVKDVVQDSGQKWYNFGQKIQNEQDIEDAINNEYSYQLSQSTTPNHPDVKQRAYDTAVAEVKSQGSRVQTSTGSTFVMDAGGVDQQAKAASWGGLDEVIKHAGSNEYYMDQINQQVGENVSAFWGNDLSQNLQEVTVLNNNEIMLGLTDKDGGIHHVRLDMPQPNDPNTRPPAVKTYEARHRKGMSVVNDDEQWKAVTDDKYSPREDMTFELDREMIIADWPRLAEKHGYNKWQQPVRRDDPRWEVLRGDITQQDRLNYMPAEIQNQALRQRQEEAVTNKVNEQTRRDKFESLGIWGANVEPTKTGLKDTRTAELSEIQVPFYGPGESWQESQLEWYKAQADKRKQDEKIREAFARSILDPQENLQ